MMLQYLLYSCIQQGYGDAFGLLEKQHQALRRSLLHLILVHQVSCASSRPWFMSDSP